MHETGDLANLKIQNANIVVQLRALRKEEEIRSQEALLRDKEIVKLKKEIRELQLTREKKKDRPRIVSDVPIKTNIVVLEEIRRLPAPERGGMSSGSAAVSASESEEITAINKQISEIAARRRYLRSNLNPSQALGTERVPIKRIRPRLEEFPALAPGVGDRGRDREAVRLRESVRAEVAREMGSQSARRGSRPPPLVTRRTPRTTMRRRSPRSAVVSITCSDTTLSYSDALKRAREKIGPLDKLGIQVSKMRVWNIDDTVDSEEVRNVISVTGDCNPVDVRVGPICRTFNGLNSVWAKCPLAAAIKVTEEGRIRMGWTSARMKLLEAHPVQCFKCWRFGHVRNTCKYSEDRTGNCFRCGSSQHMVRDCRASH